MSLKPNVAYLVLNLCALWKKQPTLLSLAYAGIPYQVLGERGWHADFDDGMDWLGHSAIPSRHIYANGLRSIL